MDSREILENTVNQAISDFDNIENAIEDMGVDVPSGTDTKEYGNKVREVYDKGHDEGYSEGYSVAESKYDGKPYLDTSQITNFSRFCTDNRFTYNELQRIDTSNGTEFTYMFQNSNKLTAIPQIDTSKGTNFSYFFHNCTILTTIPQIDTSKGTSFNSTFGNCSALTAIPQIDTSKGTSFNGTFTGCSALTAIPQIDTSKGTNFTSMFNKCSALITIPKLNLSTATTVASTFTSCTNLQHITFEGTIGINLNMQNCTKLTHDSLMSIINALVDKSGTTGTWKVTVGPTNVAKLTSEELEIATNKGWDVV